MKGKADKERRRVILAGIAGIATQWVADAARAQDAAKVRPDEFRVVLENEKVRVLELVSRPGRSVCGIGRHTHPQHLVIALSDARIRVTLPDGRKIIGAQKLGDVAWSDPEEHTTENIGGSPIRALLVEVKEPTRKA